MSSSDHDHHRGLQGDLERMLGRPLSRRRMFGWMAGTAAGLAVLPSLGCASDDAASGPDAATGPDAAGTCGLIPEETAGPYPGDGSNGVNVLTQSGVVRSDIRASFGSSTTVAGGVALTITLTIVDSACAPLANRAVYLWHCSQAGLYSLYSAGVTGENYLRGVQVTDSAGQVSFTSIFPGCYAGRWPHIHFEVYPSLASATASGNKIATSQLALPKAACDAVYATTGYSASVANLAQISLASDNVFGSDQAISQLASMSGSTASGYVASLTVGIAS